MSANESQDTATHPFGYTYIGDHQRRQDQTESHPPSGPPLLDNNETGLLRDFFDNPNNIDPSFLAAPQDRLENDPYTSASQQQWLLGGLHSQQDQSPRAAPNSHQISPIQPFGPHQSPTEDVYAAARLLHSNQSAYQNGTMAQQSFTASAHAPQAPMYGYTQASQDDLHAQGHASSQASSSNHGLYAGLLAQNQSTPARRPTPLNFGSDNKFKDTKYVAPKMQKAPDQDLMDLFSTFSQDATDSPTQPQHQPPGRKRRRSSISGEGEEWSEEESGAKRGKVSAGIAKHGGEGSATGKSRSHRRSGPRGKAASSPGQRQDTSPPGGRKAARENLTEEQKRSNHIQSEQKRRNLIKMGFEDTNHMVPELRAGGFSKSNMLQEAAKFMRELKSGNDRLAAMLGLIDKG